MSEFNKDSLTLEETNALRAKLGLKPLVDDGPSAASGSAATDDAPVDSLANQDELAMANYAKRAEEQAKEKEEREARERIAKARNKRELARKLKGSTLGEMDPSSSSSGAAESKDTLRMLKQIQKRAKENAARRAAQQEAEEAQTLAQYGEADLAGLRVGHDVDEFDLGEGQERILTLRDARILDGDGEDELVDAELDQSERDRANAERKRGAKQYTGLDDDQFDAAEAGRKRGVLAKYDADLPEKDRGMRLQDEDSGFRLGAPVRDRAQEVRKKQEETASMLNKQMLNLDYLKNQAVSDYLQEGDVGFKKPKTKRKKKRAERVKLDLDEDEDRAVFNEDASGDVIMDDTEVSTNLTTIRRDILTDNFVDDDELAASLAKARRAKAKKAFVKMTPEMIAQNLKSQAEAEAAESARAAEASVTRSEQPIATNSDEGGLTIDETSEFVRNIANRPAEDKRRITTRIKREGDERDDATIPTPTSSVRIKREDDDEELTGMDVEVAEEGEFEASPYEAERSLTPKKEEGERDLREGLPPAEPQTAGAGLAGTLALLRNQGLLQEVTPEQRERERRQLANDAWRAARRREDEAREAERRASKAQGSAKDQATREWENRQREAEEARRAAEKFKDYKPDIEIKYHDSYGRELGNKEAWKALSHRFHGKDPGHNSQEHVKKRIEQELKKERMLAGDTQGGIEKMFQARAEATGLAHMVLSVGNRGNAPQDMPDLGPNLNAAHASGNAAGRRARTTTEGLNGTLSVELGPGDSITPLPRALQTGKTSASPAPRVIRRTASPALLAPVEPISPPPSAVAVPTPPAVMRKAGFAPVAATTIAPSSTAPTNGEASTSTNATKFKLAFGTKRAAEGATGEERGKRRG